MLNHKNQIGIFLLGVVLILLSLSLLSVYALEETQLDSQMVAGFQKKLAELDCQFCSNAKNYSGASNELKK